MQMVQRKKSRMCSRTVIKKRRRNSMHRELTLAKRRRISLKKGRWLGDCWEKKKGKKKTAVEGGEEPVSEKRKRTIWHQERGRVLRFQCHEGKKTGRGEHGLPKGERSAGSDRKKRGQHQVMRGKKKKKKNFLDHRSWHGKNWRKGEGSQSPHVENFAK